MTDYVSSNRRINLIMQPTNTKPQLLNLLTQHISLALLPRHQPPQLLSLTSKLSLSHGHRLTQIKRPDTRSQLSRNGAVRIHARTRNDTRMIHVAIETHCMMLGLLLLDDVLFHREIEQRTITHLIILSHEERRTADFDDIPVASPYRCGIKDDVVTDAADSHVVEPQDVLIGLLLNDLDTHLVKRKTGNIHYRHGGHAARALHILVELVIEPFSAELLFRISKGSLPLGLLEPFGEIAAVLPCEDDAGCFDFAAGQCPVPLDVVLGDEACDGSFDVVSGPLGSELVVRAVGEALMVRLDELVLDVGDVHEEVDAGAVQLGAADWEEGFAVPDGDGFEPDGALHEVVACFTLSHGRGLSPPSRLTASRVFLLLIVASFFHVSSLLVCSISAEAG